MPSRQPPSPPLRPLVSLSATSPPPPPPEPHNTQPHIRHNHRISHLIPPVTGGAAALSILLFLAVLYRKLSRKRTVPADLKPPHRFSYTVLRRATSSFSSSNRLGQGGFGSVYRGTLPSGQEIAVKLMDSGSLQGEREFQNELSLAGKIDSDRVVSLLGFSCDRKRRRLLLVYELMHNRSLQDSLLDSKKPELMEWKKRLSISIDIAKGLEFLHTVCDPAVIHGDIKPSNILLDSYFSAKIADFGLARLKTENSDTIAVEVVVKINGSCGGQDNGSIIEETESVTTTTTYEDTNATGLYQSPESFIRVSDVDADADASVSPETTFVAEVSPPSEILDNKTSVSEGYFDKISVDSCKGVRKKTSVSGKDWWWRQENGVCASDSGVGVKDYVMEWIGNEIKKERPKSDWINASADEATGVKKKQRRLEWWSCLDEEEKIPKKEKNRQPREWWREEFCEELAKKKKKTNKKGFKSKSGDDLWWERKDKMKKKRSRSSKSSSVDWWLDGLSGEIPKSGGGVSSTPSMRGTVCYVAPEYGGGGQLSEKCDVYSFGVLLLVIISGRRPLQVTGSPMSEFERANLISWARQLAHTGKLLDLVDPSIQSLDREQALLCITIALLCLQRSPTRRPEMKEVVAMLSGESELPHLPFEFSPSPPSNFPFKSRNKPR